MIGKGIFVRREYAALFSVIKQSPKYLFSIEGVPGIGKSMMIPYVVWRLLHAPEGKPSGICLRLMHARRFFRIDTRSNVVSSIDEGGVQAGDWFLYDGGARDDIRTIAHSADYRKVKLVLFMSPRKSNRDSCFVPKGLNRKIMSPYTLKELAKLHLMVYAEQGLTAHSVEERYRRIGGVPRYIFEEPQLIDAMVDGAVRGVNPLDVMEDTGDLGYVTIGEREEKATFKAVQFWHRKGDDTYSYEFGRARYASQEIMDRLLNKWDAMEWKRVLDVVYKGVGGTKTEEINESIEAATEMGEESEYDTEGETDSESDEAEGADGG
eukprot:gb/GECG01003470.1/.p1 GENE.gb/GECG01003470.1/~~gb/GECG01003470.1/.p1  ORF type:complete len:322 (+),score=46.59 gb/GECG01003470.1/:1-966(+)